MSTMLTDPPLATLADRAQSDRRALPRYEIFVPVDVSTRDGLLLSGETINVSGSGLRFRSPLALGKGTRLVVRFKGCLPRKAEVAWQAGEEIGCRFLQPLSAKKLADIAGH